MNLKIAWCWLFCIGLNFGNLCRAQDIVHNGDFESGSLPFEWAQFDRLSDWSSVSEIFHSDNPEEEFWGHSPDYFDDQYPFSPLQDISYGERVGVAPIDITAHSGHRFVGLDDYELFQQDYGHASLQERRFYTISMWIRPSSYNFLGSSNLNIYLSGHDFKYNDHAQVSEAHPVPVQDYMSYHSTINSQLMASVPINLNDYPADRWSRVSTTFYVSADLNTSFRWLVIDMNSGGNSSTAEGHYVFIDDVSFVRAEYCSSACAPDLPGPDNGEVQNVMVADAFCPGAPNCSVCTLNRYTDTCDPPVNEFEPTAYDNWCCPIKFYEMRIWNAVGVNFWVRSRWGEQDIVYERHEFDANGLKFPDQDYFVLQWMGRDMNGQHLPAGTYDYELEYWNCIPGSEHSIESSLYYEVGDEYYDQPPEVVNGILEDCCPDHLYFQDYTFSGLVLENASDFITAGSNVTSGTQGPVIVPSTANVTFHAGGSINLEPGFSVEAGGEFAVVISDCVYGDPKSLSYRPEFNLSSMSGWHKPAEESIAVFPNPTRGMFHVRMPETSDQGSITVMDPAGKVVRTFNVRSGFEEFDMTGLARGIYFLEISGKNGFLQSFRLSYE